MAPVAATEPETMDAIPPPEPLKANRRSLMRRLFGRNKNKNQTDEDVIEHRGKAGKNAKASKKVNKKKPDPQPAGEDREPEAAKNETPKASEEKEVKPEEPKTTPTDAPADGPTDSAAAAEKVVPETVSESATDEENTTSTAESPVADKDGAEDKAEETVETEKEKDADETTPTTEEPKADEEPAQAEVQSGDDSSRDPPLTKIVGAFCGCI